MATIPRVLLGLCLAWAGLTAHARTEQPVRVFAAASLTNALDDIATAWAAQAHPRPRLAFGASSTLARQIDAGAPVDLFVSADERWMDYLVERRRVEPASRRDVVGNTLVLVAPRDRVFAVELRRGFAFDRAFDGRLCIAEPAAVPAGRYAREALESLGFWSAVAKRVVSADDVRAALAFVERGECAAGIVYATDAAVSRRVAIVARFPAGSHRPIVYPAALVSGGSADARAFLDFVQTAPAARRTFERYGFVVPSSTMR
jgi:molybdate transport system substrate-binding protein